MELSEDRRDYWTPPVLAQALLGIWFAASHQPWMNLDFVVLELCTRPEYIPILRSEIGDYSQLDYHQLEDLPILDSFIKETVRATPFDERKGTNTSRYIGSLTNKQSDSWNKKKSSQTVYFFRRWPSCSSWKRGLRIKL